jgi:hypothetical protein
VLLAGHDEQVASRNDVSSRIDVTSLQEHLVLVLVIVPTTACTASFVVAIHLSDDAVP